MKKLVSVIILTMMMFTVLVGCASTEQETTVAETQEEVATEETVAEEESGEEELAAEVVEPVDVNVVGLKGPTAMGMVDFMNRIDSGEEMNHNYNFSMTAATDEVTAALAKGEVDIAAVPANLASVLYANTEGAVQVLGINTLGVLYILEHGDSITDIESLRGQTIVSAGKGGTPEMALRYVLLENGIDPDVDVTIEWKTEQSECLAYLTATEGAIAMMPEPFVTTALLANENINVKLDLTEEWDYTQEGAENPSSLITGVVVARTDFVEENEDAVKDFMIQYKASVEFVNSNIEEAATLIGNYEITTYDTAVIAIPNCNIVYIDGADMRTALEGYLSVLYDQNPAAVGGDLPTDEFYYIQ